MDYKLNILAKELKCEELGIPDIPTLKFGKLENEKIVFNATAHLKEIGREVDYRDFSRAMRFWIEQLAKGYGLPISELFYQNPNGDQLYSEILVHIFLMFLDPEIIIYYNDLVDDVMANGMAFSDSFVLELAKTRLTPDLIKVLNDNRKKDSSV